MATVENNMESPQKLKVELLYDPEILFLDIYPVERKSLSQKDTCTPMFIVALFMIAKSWKQPKCPLIDKWIKKMSHTPTHIYTHPATLMSLNKEGNLSICNNIGETGGHYAKGNKLERHGITYMRH